MFIEILKQTPPWVFVLFAALSVMGWTFSRDRMVSVQRGIAVPVALFAVSAAGVVTAFGFQFLVVAIWLAGVATALVMTELLGWRWTRATYDAGRTLVAIVGSWVPMMLIMTVFAIKFIVGILLATQPELAADPAFWSPVTAIYGLFGGLFLSSGLRIFQAVRSSAAPAGKQIAA